MSHSIAARRPQRYGRATFRTIKSASTLTPGADVSDVDVSALLSRVEGILGRIEAVLPPVPPPPDWHAYAFRWRKRAGRGYLQPVRHPHGIRLDDLVAIDEQKQTI